MNDLKRTTLDKINLKHVVLIGNVYEKIWEWMAIGTRYLYAPPLQCRQSRIFRPAPAQTVSLGPDIEGGAFDIEGARRLCNGVRTIFDVNFVEGWPRGVFQKATTACQRSSMQL